MIKFTQLTDKLPYPKKFKAKLSTFHSEVIGYIMEHFQNTNSYKNRIVSVMNTVSYTVIVGDTIPQNWFPIKSLDTIEHSEIDDLECVLGDLYIDARNIIWDIEEIKFEDRIQHKPHKIEVKVSKKDDKPTPKEDLYIKPPTFPQFDVSKPWLNVGKDGEVCTIYTSLPIIPKNQRDISVTTNIDLMTKSDLMHLYPNHFIKTRAPTMYETNENLPFDNDLGIILPIQGFTYEQVRENIIKYPHFYKLKRKIGEEFKNFYSDIEIDGELYDTLEIWDSLPDSNQIPKTAEFIKEYVIRRYLLERDLNKVEHQFPVLGNLDPFLTLFTTPADYIRFGFSDVENIARQCISSRVQYLQTRNPILRYIKEGTQSGMRNYPFSSHCPFSSRCTECVCNQSCPALVEISYLMERNDISIENPVFHTPVKEEVISLLHKSIGKLNTVITDNTINTSTLVTYCAICENWYGNRLNCSVYHLRFSNYLDSIQQSWSVKNMPEQLEYEQIWIATAKILVISNLDFVQFKDFQAQTLLNIIHNRMSSGLTTIIVSPKLNTLIGSGTFFQRMQSILREAVVK